MSSIFILWFAAALLALLIAQLIRQRRKWKAQIAQIQLPDDMIGPTQWLRLQTNAFINFSQPYGSQFAVTVSCTDTKGNQVSSPRCCSDLSAADAFQKAILEIEKTVGREWRGYRPGVRDIPQSA